MQDTQQDHHTQEFVQATILTQYMTACLPAKADIIQHADHINGQKSISMHIQHDRLCTCGRVAAPHC